MVRQLAEKFNHYVRLLRLPKTLLISNVVLDSEHKRAILAENEIERSWYRGVKGFETVDQILAAAAVGRLTKVEPAPDYLPIMRLRNKKLIHTYPAYLTASSKALLDEIGAEWRKRMLEAGFDPRIRLAVTSLLRTMTYQATIVRAGKLADPESVHTRGEAMDLDASGYYLDETPINPRSQMQKDFAKAFKDMKADMVAAEFGDYALYEPEVHTILKQVLLGMQEEGKLHFVHEFPGSGNDAFHICRNPAYDPCK